MRIAWCLKDVNYIFHAKNNILLAEHVRKLLFLPLKNKIHTFVPRCYIYGYVYVRNLNISAG